MTTVTKIDVTGADLREMTRAAFNLSHPVGMGHMHASPGDITEEALDSAMQAATRPANGQDDVVLYLDYMEGRRVKLMVVEDAAGRWIVYLPWRSHDEDDLATLLSAAGVEYREV